MNKEYECPKCEKKLELLIIKSGIFANPKCPNCDARMKEKIDE